MSHTWQVTIESTPGGPDAAMRDRLARCAAFRLGRLNVREGYYPKQGDFFDMLDHFSGRFLWERSDQELADEPPSRVDYEVVRVEPAERPASDQTISVVARIVF